MTGVPEVTEREIADLHERLAREAEEGGYHLNPDREVTRGLARGLLVNEKRHGYWLCPCRLGDDDGQEDLDIDPEDMDRRLEEVAPEVFAEEDAWRRRLEEEYLNYQRWFREQGLRIPNAGWRSEYVEEVLALGYTTLLGD